MSEVMWAATATCSSACGYAWRIIHSAGNRWTVSPRKPRSSTMIFFASRVREKKSPGMLFMRQRRILMPRFNRASGKTTPQIARFWLRLRNIIPTQMDSAPKVLAIQFKYYGDAVLMTPALRAIREHWPQGELHVLVPEEIA